MNTANHTISPFPSRDLAESRILVPSLLAKRERALPTLAALLLIPALFVGQAMVHASTSKADVRQGAIGTGPSQTDLEVSPVLQQARALAGLYPPSALEGLTDLAIRAVGQHPAQAQALFAEAQIQYRLFFEQMVWGGGRESHPLYLQAWHRFRDAYLSFLARHPDEASAREAIHFSLNLDDMTWRLAAHRQRIERDRNSETIGGKVAELIQKKSLLSEWIFSESQEKSQREAMERELETLEKSLWLGGREAWALAGGEPDQLRGVLPPARGMVVFLRFRQVDFQTGQRTEPKAVAILVDHADPGFRMIHLDKLSEITATMDRFRKEMMHFKPDNPGTTSEDLLKRLYTLLWAPIAPYIQDKKGLYLVQEQTLASLPLAALIDEQGRYLAESLSLIPLSSSRDPLFQVATGKKSDPLLFVQPILPTSEQSVSTDMPADSSFSEAEQVTRLLQRHTLPSTLYSRQFVNSEALRAVRGPFLLHLGVTRLSQIRENGLLWTEKTTQEIPSLVQELASVDLRGTEMVALWEYPADGEDTAPHTLSQALLAAGAKTVLVPLWGQKQGKSAGVFMNAFYAYWLDGLPKQQAFRRTQLEWMRDPHRRHPYHWAAFSLAGTDWQIPDEFQAAQANVRPFTEEEEQKLATLLEQKKQYVSVPASQSWIDQEMASILYAAGHVQEADDRMYRAWTQGGMHNDVIEFYRGIGNKEKVLELLRQFLLENPENASAYRNLSDELMKQGRMAEAKDVWQVLPARAPGPDYDLFAAKFYADLQLPDKAILSLEQYLRDNPDNREAFLDLVNLLTRSSRGQEADVLWEKRLGRDADPDVQSDAAKFYAEKDPQKAIILLRSFLEKHPDSPAERFLLAELLLKIGQKQEAFALMEGSGDDQDKICLKDEVLRFYEQQGVLDKVLACRKQRVALSPRDVWVFNEYIAAVQGVKGVDASARLWDERMLQETDPDWLEAAGKFFLDVNHPDKARVFFERRLKEEPDSPDALQNMALALQRMGQLEQAEMTWETIVRLNPSFRLLDDAADFYKSRGKRGREIALRRKAVQAEPTFFSTTHQLTDALLAVGNREESEAILLSAVQSMPERDTVLALVAWYRKTGQPDQALSLLEQFMERHPDIADKYLELLKNNRRIDEAIIFLDKIVTENINPDLFNISGQFFRSIGHSDKAVSLFKKAIAYSSNDNFSYFSYVSNLVGSLAESGRILEAEQIIDPASQDYALSHSDRYLLYQLIGRTDKAIDLFQKPSAIHPAHVETYSDLLLKSGRLNEAKVYWENMLTSSQSSDLYPKAAEYHIQIGEYDRALVLLREYIRTGQYAIGFFERIVDDLLRAGFVAEAQAFLEKIPVSESNISAIAKYHIQFGQLKKALSLYQRVDTSPPTTVAALEGISSILLKMGQTAEAETVWNTVSEADKEVDLSLLRAKALFLMEIGHPERAVSLLRRYLVVNRDDPTAIGDLSRALVAAGKMDDAKTLWEESVATNSETLPLAVDFFNSIGDTERSIALAQTYRAMEAGQSASWYLLATALVVADRLPEAQQVLDEAAQRFVAEGIDESTARFWSAYGALDQWVSSARRALAKWPKDVKTATGLARALWESGAVDEAKDYFPDDDRIGMLDAADLEVWSSLFAKNGEFAKALALSERCLRMEARSTACQTTYLIALYQMGRQDEADHTVESLVQAWQEVTRFLVAGEYYLATERYSEGLRFFQELGKHPQQAKTAREKTVLTRFLAGEPALAMAELEKEPSAYLFFRLAKALSDRTTAPERVVTLLRRAMDRWRDGSLNGMDKHRTRVLLKRWDRGPG